MSFFKEELEKLREQFRKASPGSKEQESITEQMCKMHDAELKEVRDNASFEEMSAKIEALEREKALAEKEAKHKKIFSWISLVATTVPVVIGLCFNRATSRDFMNLETTGSITSKAVQATNNVDRLYEVKL